MGGNVFTAPAHSAFARTSNWWPPSMAVAGGVNSYRINQHSLPFKKIGGNGFLDRSCALPSSRNGFPPARRPYLPRRQHIPPGAGPNLYRNPPFEADEEDEKIHCLSNTHTSSGSQPLRASLSLFVAMSAEAYPLGANCSPAGSSPPGGAIPRASCA